jgi:hypothetical protein
MIHNARAELLNQRAAARLLGVSPGWLRSSSAPRLLLPGNGLAHQPLLRYSRTALLEWAGLTYSRTQQGARPRTTSAQADAAGRVADPRDQSAGASGG